MQTISVFTFEEFNNMLEGEQEKNGTTIPKPDPETQSDRYNYGDGETSTYIRVKFAKEGIHRWADCPHEDVKFLRDWHRHMFHFDVKIQVFHGDRELEFIRVKRELEIFVETFVLPNKTGASCETMAKNVLEFLIDRWGANRTIVVEVLEDNENGGIVEYVPWIDWVEEAEKNWENQVD